jgi:ABC-type polysaccharide/polyol phosphate export permease
MQSSSVFITSLSNFRIWSHLGWRDLRAQYARTKLGPWWSAASLAAIIAGSSLAIGLLGNNKALSLTPQLGIGLAVWTLISVSLNEGAELFESERSLLLNSTIDELSLVLRVIWRNVIVFFHNLPIVAIALWLGGYQLTWNVLLFIPLTLLVLPALIFPVAFFARLTLWKRALKSLLPSIIQVGFFLTPILWSPPEAGPMKIVFDINPVGWFVVLVKEAVLNNNVRWDLLTRCLIVVVLSITLIELLQSQLRNVRKLI